MATDLATLDNPTDLATEVSPHVEWANALIIQTGLDYEEAAQQLKAIKALIGKIEQHHQPMKKAASDAHKKICEQEKGLLAPLLNAEALAKRKLLGYQQAEAAKAEKERQRLQALADEKARREREALEAKAAKAVKPETKAKYQEAAAQVAPAPVVAVAANVPKVAGLQTRVEWTFQITDLSLLPKEYMLPNEKALGQLARSLKEHAPKIPGVRFFPKDNMAAGSR